MKTSAPTSSEPGWVVAVDRCNYALALVAGAAGALLVMNIVISVLARLSSGRPLPATLDISTYVWMPIVTVLGMAYALRRSEHIRVSLLTASASVRTQRITEIGSMAFTVLILVLLTVATFDGALEQAQLGETAMATPWLAIWPMRFVVGIGILGFTLQAVAELARALRSGSSNTSEEVGR